MSVNLDAVKKGATRAKSGNILIYGRLSFPDLFEPGQDQQGQPVKCGTTLLLTPNYDTSLILADLKSAWEKKFGTDPKKWPKGQTVRTPENVIRDAAEKQYAGYEEGWRFLAARVSKMEDRPDVRDLLKPMVEGKFAVAERDPRVVYPGRWAIISVQAFGYDNRTKGVSLGLNNVLLDAHAEALGGAPARAETDFDGIAAEQQPVEDALA
jgi:Protein of unknown function (DUF2815)